MTTTIISAQRTPQGRSGGYPFIRWRTVATAMPPEWYGSDEAKRVAETVLLGQKDIGGWAKNIAYHRMFSESEKERFLQGKSEIGATFDNDATITELRFLARVYSQADDERYKEAFERGLDYIFMSQYKNGGWPQFFPFRDEEGEHYSAYITFNDHAMVNILWFLHEIFSGDELYTSLQISSDKKEHARKAFDRGIECILKTQIIMDDKPTVWCAQHDAQTFAPARARTYELESFSGSESVGIVLLLMSIDDPDEDIIASVNGAVEWFEKNKIEGIRLRREINQEGRRDVIVVEDKEAPPIWARFYDLETVKPIFCDRDGIKKHSLAEIGHERRNGYSWYTYAPAELLQKYPEWRKKTDLESQD